MSRKYTTFLFSDPFFMKLSEFEVGVEKVKFYLLTQVSKNINH